MTVYQLEIEQANLKHFVNEAMSLMELLKAKSIVSTFSKTEPTKDLRIYWDKER